MLKCKICSREFNGPKSLVLHTLQKHQLGSKAYYDSFLKKEGEGICRKNGCKSMTSFYSIAKGYAGYCSIKCMSTCSNIHKQKMDTCIAKYGTNFALQSEEVKKKKRSTCMDRYGVPIITMSKAMHTKSKETIRRKYGVDNVSQAEEIKEIKRRSSLEHYGTNYTLQAIEVREKVKQTMLERYGEEHALKVPHFLTKAKQSMLKRFGTEHALKVPEILKRAKEKGSQTCLQKYGTHRKGIYSNFHRLLFESLHEIDQSFVREYPISNFFVDIAHPDSKIGIECYGNFWHCNPSIYKDDHIHVRLGISAKEVWNRDNARKTKIEDKGFLVLEYWEDDILGNIKPIIKEVLGYVKRRKNHARESVCTDNKAGVRGFTRSRL